ncbi:glyoxylate reductase/hydroxypyruvate reductase [Macrosteles quadrilineatus]|uniref:glyoxylate reductase/hydroxypyruvate reductase n=1 Tax=Macrosteles quadrilineatus TaxID=74068 RepID=UPI0023E12BFE|nr:glyoxylate reductase/hydroxypyruvate reductase [Macrosteles quadrilineatus]XP_054267591.1 glyoxylate reductase/hydroxypyruvate reductase [Macrosteles quadrilineatus]
MVSPLQTLRVCWLTTSSVAFTFLQGSKRGAPLLNHTSCVAMSSSTNASGETKPKIFVTRTDYPKNGIDLLLKKYDVEIYPKEKTIISKEELILGIKGKSGIFCSLNDKIDKEVLSAAGPQLRVVSTMSVGVEHVDLKECQKLSIKVGYTPNVLTEATAELTMALLLATSRRLFEANTQLRTGGWSSWAPVWMCGPALKGSTIGLVGFGRIGREVAYKLKAFHVGKILYTDSGKSPSADKKEAATELGAERLDLEPLLAAADFVIVTCALTPQTQGMFNSQRFGLMKPTAIFINTGRGGVVDHEALYDALKNSKIWAAGLDVMTPEPLPTDHKLIELPNCVLLPHIGSATYQSRMAMSELTANNIICALEGRPMPAEYL